MNNKGPDQIYGPLLANLMQKMAQDIKKECGASAVRISCEFVYERGSGDLKLQTFTTPDAKTERLLDPAKPMPRGSKLQHEVAQKMRAAISSLLKILGGN